jgi:glycyl-tRNA synthetase beta chain
MPDVLIELFSEEIPARMQAKACEDLRKLVTDGLVEAGLTYASAGAFSTPRRLTLVIEDLAPESRAVREERKGPRTDAPDAAIEGFLRATGLSREQLEVRDDKKAQVYFALLERPGRKAADILAEVLEQVIRSFPWPKSMRWGAGSLRWVRPLHSILCLMTDEAGAAVVPLSVDHLTAGNTTEGHRFMGAGRFAVHSFDDYRAKLKRAFVELDAEERARHIWADATSAAFAAGLEVVPDPALLAEVAGLVEWPVVLMGTIAEDYLTLPPEVLQTSMRAHQKFFSVKNPASGRIERFITVANIATPDNGATILKGNQKVLSARLSDARFFWDNDLRVAKSGMNAWAEGLKSVTFHNKLGSQADRIDRIAALAREIAPMVGADPEDAAEAARLAKLDLRSAMVGEFPELQGVMGRYYIMEALKDAPPRPPSRGPDEEGAPVDQGPGSSPGRRQAIADAARDHYAPLGPSDAVPTAPVSVAVALADKIDTLTGFWAIEEKPTGSKDPFALRRAALGVIRLVVGNGSRISMSRLLDQSFLISLCFPQPEFAELLSDFKSSEVEERFLRLKSGMVLKGVAIPYVLENVYFKRLNDYFSSDDNIMGRKIGGDVELHGFISFLDELLQLSDGFMERMLGGKDSDYHDKEEQREIFLATMRPRTADLLAFLHDRLKVHLRDQGIRHDIIDACLAMPGNDDLTLLVKRAEALRATLKTDDGANLIQGFKRANNILLQAEAKDGVEYSYGADPKFAEGPEETALFAALDAAEKIISPAMASEDFTTAMAAMAKLRAPIDAFFDAVQVNSDNPIVRRNRLNLLHRIRTICAQVVDLTKLEG